MPTQQIGEMPGLVEDCSGRTPYFEAAPNDDPLSWTAQKTRGVQLHIDADQHDARIGLVRTTGWCPSICQSDAAIRRSKNGAALLDEFDTRRV